MTRSDVAGSWRLVSYEAGAGVYPMGKDAVGVLDYSPHGKVSVEGSTITHHLEMASEPSFVGKSNLRHAELRGATLILSGEMMFDGAERTIKVTWRKTAG